MACIKKYYAPNGQESILFNQLVEQYGEWRAEEIYLKLNTGDFNELFQKETEIQRTQVDNEFVKSLSWIADNTPFLRDIELAGSLNQYAEYLRSVYPNSTLKNVVWREPSDRTEKLNSLRSSLQSARNASVQKDVDYYVQSEVLPKNLRDSSPHLINISNPYITQTFYQDQKAWEDVNLKESFIDNLKFERDFDSVTRLEVNNVSTIALFDNSQNSLRLGSSEDLANFKEWMRQNPSTKSTIKIKDKKFDTKGLVYDINGEPRVDIVTSADVLSRIDNVSFQKLSPSEIASNLINSSEGKIGDAKGDIYPVLSKEVSRVTVLLNKYPEWVYKGTSAGIAYQDKGTRYHGMLEDLVDGKTKETIKKERNVQDSEISFLNNLDAFVKSKKAEGGQLIAELRVASLDANNGEGVVGTIDLVHIKPNGKVDIYDLKTAYDTESVKRRGGNIWDVRIDNAYKAKRYTAQLMIYAEMLKRGDTQLGRVPLEIDNISIIPAEVMLSSTNSDEVLGVNFKNPENVRLHENWKVEKGGKKSFYDKYTKEINDIFSSSEDVSEKKLKNEFENRGLSAFLQSAFRVKEHNEAEELTKRAITFVDNVGFKKKTFRIQNTEYTWESDKKEDRVQQVKKIFARQNQNFGIMATQEIVDYSENIYLKKNLDVQIYNFDSSENAGKLSKARASRLTKILNSCKAQKVEIVKGHDNVLLIHRGDGAYDLFSLSERHLGETIEIKNKPELFNKLGVQDSYNTLFGDYLNPLQAKQRKVTLSNTYGDYLKLKLGVIGMQISKENPNIKINRIIVDHAFSDSDVFPRATNMEEMLPQIKVMHSIPEINAMEPNGIKEILNDESLYSKSRYGENPIQELKEYIADNLDATKDVIKITDAIERYEKNQIKMEALADELLNGANGILSILKTKYNHLSGTELFNKISTDETFQALSRAYVTLKGYGINPESDVTDGFAGTIANWISNPSITGRKLLDKFDNEIRYHYNQVKSKFQSFINEKDPVIQALIDSDPMLKSGKFGTDKIFGMGRTVFERLLVTKTDAKGNRYKIPQLVPEGSAEFNALSKAEQGFIKYFNDKVQELHPDWKRGQVPIMMTGSDTYLYRAKQKVTKGNWQEAAKDAKSSVKAAFNAITTKGNFKTEAEKSRELSYMVYDRFGNQISPGSNGEFKESALSQIGLDSEMNLVDSNANELFETNLEVVLTQYVMNKLRKQEMDKALPKYYMFRSIFKHIEMAYGEISEKGATLENSIKMMDEYVEDIAFNIKQGDDKILSKWTNLGIRTASLGLIGLKPKVWIGNTVQMTVSGGLEAFLNTVVGDNRFPSLKEYSRASAIMAESKTNPLLAKKIRLARQKYMPEDLGVLSSQKYQGAARGLLTEQSVYAVDRMLELGFREHSMIAQMLKDDVWDAHSVVTEIDKRGYPQDRIVYDKSKDKRFQGKDGEALYRAIKRSMVEKGEILETEEINGAYDWNLRERMKAYIARNMGTFDRDLASPLSRHSLMHGFGQFRMWFRDKFWRATISEYDSQIFGDMKKGEDGEYYWSSEPMKGMLRTLAELSMPVTFFNMARKGELSQEDQKNLVLAATSLTSIALLSLLSAALIADDDDDEFNALKISFNAASDELLNSFTLKPFASITVSPLVFVSYYQNLFKTTFKIMGYGLDGDWEKGYNNFINVVPIIRQLPEDVIEIEED